MITWDNDTTTMDASSPTWDGWFAALIATLTTTLTKAVSLSTPLAVSGALTSALTKVASLTSKIDLTSNNGA